MATHPFHDTIAAVATAPGRGAVALVRLSGPAALEILAALCPDLAGTPPAPRRQRLLSIHHPQTGELLDRGLVTVFRAPASYTGEDTVEVSTHGGPLVPQLVLDAMLAAGARAALPGEFTRRAYLNGKLDLLQVEAVLDLVDGRSRALHRAALHQMERGLSRRIETLRHALIGVEALLVYSIDFPEEDEPPVPPERILAAARDVHCQIEGLLQTAPEGEMLREGALVVLAGRPNSGKSSLFNTLLGTERAIVTAVPGTTRDALEAEVTFEGYPFRLVDTAGLRETRDLVEGLGIEVARRYLDAAQILLFCAEAGRSLEPDEEAFLAQRDALRTIVVRTMADTLPARGDGADEWQARVAGPADTSDTPGLLPAALTLSAHTGAGLPELRRELLRLAFGGILGETGEAPLVTRQRHARALHRARDEVLRFIEVFPGALPAELAATHLRDAITALEDLIGVVSADDLLDRVLGQFCVGK